MNPIGLSSLKWRIPSPSIVVGIGVDDSENWIDLGIGLVEKINSHLLLFRKKPIG
jgi:hypothetical protein